ncbi:hypothetical protein ACFWZ2_13145 [Streptomyces sp. NPDC059002]|uniref:hypothetical protein n=1 Tax=Streptomyces sp. NPDC059002 TaxID=3346690 RepID=UPI0036894DFE
MPFAFGIFDVFTYAIPGGLQLSLVAYVLARLDVADLSGLTSGPAALVVIGAVGASYGLGHVTYPLSVVMEKLFPRWHRGGQAAREEFMARVPQARERPFVRADLPLLLAAAEQHNKETAGEVLRLRGLSLMLRNIALTLLLVMLTALAELVPADRPLLAGVCAALSAAGAVGAVREGRRMQHWARLKTLELCFWIPDIDERFTRSA